MKAKFLYDQHQRCLKAIELIESCNKYISNCRANLKRHLSLHWTKQMHGFEEYQKINIKKYTAIRERLMLYYSNQFMKMVDAVQESVQESVHNTIKS